MENLTAFATPISKKMLMLFVLGTLIVPIGATVGLFQNRCIPTDKWMIFTLCAFFCLEGFCHIAPPILERVERIFSLGWSLMLSALLLSIGLSRVVVFAAFAGGSVFASDPQWRPEILQCPLP